MYSMYVYMWQSACNTGNVDNFEDSGYAVVII